MTQIKDGWRPRVICFVCRHTFIDGVDGAKVIRVPCAGRVTPEAVMRAFHRGADAVLVAGCAPSECHCSTGSYQARRRLPLLGKVLAFLGIEAERFMTIWPERSQAGRYAAAVSELTAAVAALGPNARLKEEL